MFVSYVLLSLEFLIFVFSFQKEGIGNSKNSDCVITFFSFSLIAILTFISGFRFNVGRDFQAYEIMYNNPSDVRNYFVEPFWNNLSSFLHRLGCSSVCWFLLTSFAINFFIITTLRKYSDNFFISALFYVCIPQLFLESFNIVRQYCAISFIFYFSYLFFEKKYIKFIFIIIVAFFIHNSAILTIPFFLLSILHIPNFLLVTFIICSFLLRNAFLSIIIKIVSSIGMYSGYSSHIIASESNSGVYAFVILIINLFIIIFFHKEKNGHIIKLKNLTVFSFGIYLLFYTFQAGMRIGFYLLPYFLFLVPLIIKKMKVNGVFFFVGTLFSMFSLFSMKSGFSSYFNFRWL